MTKNNIKKLLEILSDELETGYGGEEYRLGKEYIKKASEAMYEKQKEGFWIVIGEDKSGVMNISMTNSKKEDWFYKE